MNQKGLQATWRVIVASFLTIHAAARVHTHTKTAHSNIAAAQLPKQHWQVTKSEESFSTAQFWAPCHGLWVGAVSFHESSSKTWSRTRKVNIEARLRVANSSYMADRERKYGRIGRGREQEKETWKRKKNNRGGDRLGNFGKQQDTQRHLAIRLEYFLYLLGEMLEKDVVDFGGWF